jgi:hypothetical protein
VKPVEMDLKLVGGDRPWCRRRGLTSSATTVALLPTQRRVGWSPEKSPPPRRCQSPTEQEESPQDPLDWAALFRRVYAVDVLQCPNCQGRLKVLAFLSDGSTVKKVLTHLGLPWELAPRAPACYAPEQLSLDIPFVGESAIRYPTFAK